MSRPTRQFRRFSVMILAGSSAMVIAAQPAAAQDALGSGNALDSNLSTRTRGNAPTNRMDFRSRNLLITNDVAGGRGFRGSVGYEAAGDFAGSLGSNDLFSFRSGSAYSDPGLIRYGNAYTQLRHGGTSSPIEYRRSGYTPGIYGIEPSRNMVMTRTGTDSARSMLDQISSERLTTNQNLSATPQRAGIVYDTEGQPNVVESSPLRGLYIRPEDERPAARERDSVIGRAGDPVARNRRQSEEPGVDRRAQVVSPFDTIQLTETGETQVSTRLEQPEQSGRVDNASAHSQDEYARIIQRVVDRYASVQDVDMRLDETMLRQLGVEYDQLRERLAMTGATDRTGTDPMTGEPLNPDDPRTMLTERGGTDDPGRLVQPDDMTDEEQREFEIVLNHDEVVRTLVGEEKDEFNRIMAEAEQRLRIGEFFLAERSFERALRMVRGHPLASAGFGHSQLGAGLYRSAYRSLRTLLTAHPAMIDVRYQPGLIPNRVRLLNIVTKLEERLETEDFDRDLNGFLLAYIGHQIERRDLVTKGLNAMLEADAEDPLVPTLAAVWMAPDDTVNDAADADATDGGDRNG